MKRKLIEKLLEWKEQADKKPLLITGAKGVGKTYLAYDFGKSFYDNVVYFNFETEPETYKQLLSQSEENLYEQLKMAYHLKEPDESQVLVILDDFIYCQDTIGLFSLLHKLLPDCDLLCICNSGAIVEVPKDDFYKLCLYPLDFEEFLMSTGEKWYIDAIAEHYKTNSRVPDIVHEELLSLLEQYLMVGGMPLAVNEYINTGGLFNISSQHSMLLNAYLTDIGLKGDKEALKIRQIIETVPAQLYKENKKFQYTLIRRGTTQTMYALAMEYLMRSGYGIICQKAEDSSLSDGVFQKAEEIESSFTLHNFKLYLLDVGILYSMLIRETGFQQEKLRKGLLNNYLAQSLTANGYETYYWESASSAGIDFLIGKESKVLPIEVWPDEYTRSKNISIFKSKCKHMEYSIKVSTKNFEYHNDIKYVPLYAVFCI